ncbi:hypothetical protein Vi05172_g3129 [Venturia inaequalis]|nr:hypothetical protein Vi05172_g3129 [Venturia inaequalis]
MPTFEDLPRELRQEIFNRAFDHAIKTDLSFNNNIECYIRSYKGRNRLATQPPKDLLRVLGPFPGPGDTRHPDSFAPHLCTTFEALRAAFPKVIDDAEYAFRKAIGRFEKEVLEMKKIERARRHFTHGKQTALHLHANRACLRDELFDFGAGIDGESANVSKFKIGEEMIGRLNHVIWTRHNRRHKSTLSH